MEIREQVRAAITELTAQDKKFNPVKLLAIGCSSSEIAGGTIGHASAYELGEQVANEILAVAAERGFACAFQCCEHLNRALVMERETAEKYGYEIVCVVPQPKAGGSLATAAYRALQDPVVVQEAKADAGIDIGRTLIGMHLRPVAVPVRLATDKIGEAIVIAARTRPRLIGGERAKYE
ncbi:MAG: TIGR01440 family protein [Clostridia bacterium]|nr:TIGR01440 family protein [Clostridia bacterium]